jgi:hypothetical protein
VGSDKALRLGDLHQPLHAADDHDAGGNRRQVIAEGYSGSLHRFWDIECVERLGSDPASSCGQPNRPDFGRATQEWSRGTAADWAIESFANARGDAYGRLPTPDGQGTYLLSPGYVDQAARDAAPQLSRAGVRVAFVLNRALAAAQ